MCQQGYIAKNALFSEKENLKSNTWTIEQNVYDLENVISWFVAGLPKNNKFDNQTHDKS